MTPCKPPLELKRPALETKSSITTGLLDISGLDLAVRRANPSSGFLYKKRSKDLFAHIPCLADVKQWGVGDCYLMAALLSIVNMHDGPQKIMRMMRQHENGGVFIKLYQIDTLTPHILRYEKSIIVSWEHARDCLWVQLIEKAYADFVRGSYRKLASGQSTDCFRVLLGVDAQHLVQGDSPSRPETNILAVLFSNFLHGIYNAKASRDDIKAAIFGGDDTLLTKWETWNTAERKARWTGFLVKRVGVSIKTVELEDFTSFFEGECKRDVLDEVVRRTVLEWLHEQNPLSRRAYSSKEMEAFRKIKVELAAGRPVSAGTPKTLTGRSDGKGFSAGESKVDGMVANHAYAVLNVREDENSRLWIRVRNPWGDGSVFGYGRAYDEVKAPDGGVIFRPKKTSSAESWLRLEDFMDTFSDFYLADGRQSSAPTVAMVSDVEIGAGRARRSGMAPPPLPPRSPTP